MSENLSYMSIADLRRHISSIVGPEGLMPPDWVTVKRWRERLEENDNLTSEGILEMLEAHYGKDFGAEVKLVPLLTAANELGWTDYIVRKMAAEKGMLVRVGRRLYVDRKFVEGSKRQ